VEVLRLFRDARSASCVAHHRSHLATEEHRRTRREPAAPAAESAHAGQRLIVISPMVDARARKVAEQLGIEVYHDSTDVNSLDGVAGA
jgi:hypothetical protein